MRELRLPASVVTRSYLLRGVRLWIGVRLLVSLMLLLTGGPEAILDSITGLASPAIVALCVILGVVDLWMKKERALLGNLGISRIVVGAGFLFAAVAGEIALMLLVGQA